MKEEKNYSKEFLAVFDKFSYRYPKWQIWNDFLYLSAVSMANVIKTDAWEERKRGIWRLSINIRKNIAACFLKCLDLLCWGWNLTRNRIY